MITIELVGGLGNQMFQYALAVKMVHVGKNVRIRPLFGEQSIRKYELDCFENIDIYKIPIESKNVKNSHIKSIHNYLERKLKKPTQLYKDKIIIYQPEVFELEDAYLCGYWQNEKYFSDIRNEIKKVFVFRKDRTNTWIDKIRNKYGMDFNVEFEESVSVHVRRTDYNSKENANVYGNICTLEYYYSAIKYIEERVNTPIFYFFSDDREWVSRQLLPALKGYGLDNCKLIEVDYNDTALDMWMMTRCKHHIIANSTYSWWGAWLGNSEDKIVVAPQKWMNGYSDDIICEDWIRV